MFGICYILNLPLEWFQGSMYPRAPVTTVRPVIPNLRRYDWSPRGVGKNGPTGQTIGAGDQWMLWSWDCYDLGLCFRADPSIHVWNSIQSVT